jgi:ABC-type dipeptide/oligopeptide/nickel transport system ATPase component
VTVISAGEICERGPVAQVLTAPSHAYTRQLLADVPAIGVDQSATG